ncbi:MAG: hypothetical protein MAG794_01589 [Gammaproteobacteria bacterium]|nr:hypothetical protein [Gammaproteobacteria bacterium]
MSSQELIKTVTKSLILGALFIFSLTAVHAVNVGQAKQQGMACELPTGYLQARNNATPEVKAMVVDINAKRKAEYTRIANENGVKPENVGLLTAKKLGPKCP